MDVEAWETIRSRPSAIVTIECCFTAFFDLNSM